MLYVPPTNNTNGLVPPPTPHAAAKKDDDGPAAAAAAAKKKKALLLVQSDDAQHSSSSSQSRKVFINVCTSAHVGAPKHVTRLNSSGEAVSGLSVPVAVGPPRFGGKGGLSSLTFDVVVSAAVIAECDADETGQYRDFVCQLVMDYVEQKSAKDINDGGLAPDGTAKAGKTFAGVKLDRRYKLPKLKYHCYVVDADGGKDDGKPCVIN